MPKRRLLPGESAPDVAGIAGLMGPMAIPGALGGVLGKAIELGEPERQLLDKLLGRPIRLGQKLMRLSSFDPEQNRALLHAASGERVATPIDELLKAWKTIGADTPEMFQDSSVITAPGVKAPAASIGAKGGLRPMPRKLTP